jgi:hypothetical protein
MTVVQAYKRIKVTQGMMDHPDWALIVDHEALHDLCAHFTSTGGPTGS